VLYRIEVAGYGDARSSEPPVDETTCKPLGIGDTNVTSDRERRAVVPDRKAVTGGFSPSVDFISSIIAGLLLGIALDWWLGTRPLFIVIFIIAGFATGFFKLWQHSSVLEEQAEGRRREL
jgi:F0F1-type ATP synthase assembly protein I